MKLKITLVRANVNTLDKQQITFVCSGIESAFDRVVEYISMSYKWQDRKQWTAWTVRDVKQFEEEEGE